MGPCEDDKHLGNVRRRARLEKYDHAGMVRQMEAYLFQSVRELVMQRQFFRHEFHATLQRVLGRFALLCGVLVPAGSSSDVWTSIPPPPNLCRQVFDEVEAVYVQLRDLSSTQGLENVLQSFPRCIVRVSLRELVRGARCQAICQ